MDAITSIKRFTWISLCFFSSIAISFIANAGGFCAIDGMGNNRGCQPTLDRCQMIASVLIDGRCYYMDNKSQNRNSEKFNYSVFASEEEKMGMWCITTSKPQGIPDAIKCIYEAKSDCIDANKYRHLNRSRCVKNPRYSDENE